MNTEMNRAMILESRRAIEQSERVKKLTLMATYFIPLTFTSSLFGMNFDVLGQSDVPVWWFLVLGVPLTIITYILGTYSWSRRDTRPKNLRAALVTRWEKWRTTKDEAKDV